MKHKYYIWWVMVIKIDYFQDVTCFMLTSGLRHCVRLFSISSALDLKYFKSSLDLKFMKFLDVLKRCKCA